MNRKVPLTAAPEHECQPLEWLVQYVVEVFTNDAADGSYTFKSFIDI